MTARRDCAGSATLKQAKLGTFTSRAITELGDDVTAAAGKIATVKPVQEVLNSILDEGAACVLGMPAPNPAGRIGFVTDDGSVDALLGRLQLALALDEAGPLPLPAHGSTATGVLAVAEAMTAVDIADTIVLADDFGDDLDAASGEFLASVLRRTGGQVWLSTRRPEVVRAFDLTEVIRLTRSHGGRRHHQFAATTDKRAPLRASRRRVNRSLFHGDDQGGHNRQVSGDDRRVGPVAQAPAAVRQHEREDGQARIPRGHQHTLCPERPEPG